MTERIERVIMVILAVIVGILSIWFWYSKMRMREDQIQILSYQSQIMQLEVESEAQARRFEDSRKRANFEMQRVKDDTQRVLATKVPKDCKQAMDWGRRAAQAFR